MKRSGFLNTLILAPLAALMAFKKQAPVVVSSTDLDCTPVRFHVTGKNQFGELIEEWIEIPKDNRTVATRNKLTETWLNSNGEDFRIEIE